MRPLLITDIDGLLTHQVLDELQLPDGRHRARCGLLFSPSALGCPPGRPCPACRCVPGDPPGPARRSWSRLLLRRAVAR